MVGNGPALAFPTQLFVDAQRRRAFVVDIDRNAVLAVDLDTGDRSVAYNAVGAARPLKYNDSVAFDPAGARLFISQRISTYDPETRILHEEGEVIEVDLETGGSRTAARSDDSLLGVGLLGLTYDPIADRLVFSTVLNGLKLAAIDIATGGVVPLAPLAR